MIGQRPLAIRRLEATDVHAVLALIRDCRREFEVGSCAPAVLEPSDLRLFETYRQRRSTYFVAVVGGEVVGGAGVGRLADGDGSTCELQRMYLRPAVRGLGVEDALLAQCLTAARQFQYRHCYAGTIAERAAALALYERHGFRRLDAPLGRTGRDHNDCWLLMNLQVMPEGIAVGI